MPHQTITAALIVIGDEILSGRTKDKNIGTIADGLTAVGIDLKEVRVVPDEEPRIIDAVNHLRRGYHYLFTTGGIGPTHDDITADAIAKAFGVGIDIDPRAVAMLRERYAEGELNEARLRMARIPHGASLIENPISKAPGFMLGNVIVMAGVPAIMRLMLDAVLPRLETGAKMIARSLPTGPGIGEGLIAAPLAAIAAAHPDVSIGSYPSFGPEGFEVHLVVRGKDEAKVEAARAAIAAMIAGVQAGVAAKQGGGGLP